MMFDDFDTTITAEEFHSEDLCTHCGTDHSDKTIEDQCNIEREEEMREFISQEIRQTIDSF